MEGIHVSYEGGAFLSLHILRGPDCLIGLWMIVLEESSMDPCHIDEKIKRILFSCMLQPLRHVSTQTLDGI